MTTQQMLQEILNKCMELGWRPRGQGRWGYEKGSCDEDGMYISYGVCISYHELFSKDSGVMEFVEWKENYNHFKLYPIYIDSEGNLYKHTLTQYHYMMMSYLTAEEKIQYFIDNAIIPTK